MTRSFLVVLALATMGLGAKAPPKPVSPDEVAIEAKSTEFDGANHTYKVAGDVRLEVRDLKVTCKEAQIYLSRDDRNVERILFTGEVVAIRGRSTFRGDKVTYHVTTRKLTAEGNTRTRLTLPGAKTAGHR
jgi:lipopolysaccharide export system protein LptA